MKTYIIGFFAAIVPMLILDGVWLTTMIKTFYTKHLGDLFAPKPSLLPALVFYVLYGIGVLYFVILPLVRSNAQLSTVFLTGALFGLVAYGTYDLTNQATLKNWPTIVTIVDLAWGSFLTGFSATCAVWVMRLMRLM